MQQSRSSKCESSYCCAAVCQGHGEPRSEEAARVHGDSALVLLTQGFSPYRSVAQVTVEL